ncbi:MAG: sugar phosphate nucleotidyltransferase [Candidatus Margulisiibacteriota bacterium]|jgi:bifunctional UDP-N-acetylglucosamine pyrophosphorylase/glucosamine-1-phosphate N-acetyltransferase
MNLKAIILAAGKGTRMKSEFLKVLHEIAGKPIINYVIDTVKNVGIEEIILVVGHQAELVKKITDYTPLTYALQEEQLGTGHAVMQTEPYLTFNRDEEVIILAGDCPLISKETLTNLIATHKESNAQATVLTTIMEEPGSYGRILRGKMGTITGIKEAKDCTPEEYQIKEINTGIYCFKSNFLFEALKKITNNNVQNEYYLTDVIHILKAKGDAVAAYCTNNANEALGINTRMDIAEINKIVYRKNNLHFMKEGVTIIDPETTFIDSTAKIGRDTIIYPFSFIKGEIDIPENSIIEPFSYLK